MGKNGVSGKNVWNEGEREIDGDGRREGWGRMEGQGRMCGMRGRERQMGMEGGRDGEEGREIGWGRREGRTETAQWTQGLHYN